MTELSTITYSSDEDTGVGEAEQIQKQKRGKGDVFSNIREFPSASEALNFVRNEKTWSMKQKFSVRSGQKIQYICKYSRQNNGNKCPAKAEVLFYSEFLGAFAVFWG
jgi:hypothetical protein